MKIAVHALLAVFSAAWGAQDVSRAAAMNIADRSATISREGVRALERIAGKNPALRLVLEQTLEAPFEAGELKVIQKFELPKGTRFLNSGVDRQGRPVQYYSTAKGGEVVYVLKAEKGQTVQVKDLCLNPISARVSVPLIEREVETTWNIQEVTVEVSINFAPTIKGGTAVASATAQTAPITITINNVAPGAPPMMVMGGGQSPFVYVRDSRGLLSLGYLVGGQMRVYNNTQVCVTNNNANSNTNVNNNTNVVNTGSGSASGITNGSGNSSTSAGGK